MKNRTDFILTTLLIGSILLASPAFAEKKHAGKDHHPPATHGKTHKKDAKGHSHKGGMHLFTSDWHGTLTEHQKLEVDKMHITLMRESAPIKAMITVKKTELALLVTQESPDHQAIDKKIDEILELKRQKIQKRFHHIAEMRQILSPEQRLSYDMMIIGRAKKSGK